ncbi:hypothetical protein [Pseudofrankia sp. BMG5.37]|uniref:hypothetical protein n=1 Tax=Pseudofrankia sp. BMG5.37 TaxID=3050035 RepID=UPI00289411EB|nr:hypothetical protein [Pseudofrankia sp. BMG5.37]MDT3444490.1 hypothetical protein [Pseudofrankia sp. BMG5.37]
MRVEPGVVVTAGSTVVVFEAKYTSLFSVYPAGEATGGGPLHQLAAQYAALRAATAANGWPDPVVVAVTVGSIPPTADLELAARLSVSCGLALPWNATGRATIGLLVGPNLAVDSGYTPWRDAPCGVGVGAPAGDGMRSRRLTVPNRRLTRSFSSWRLGLGQHAWAIPAEGTAWTGCRRPMIDDR